MGSGKTTRALQDVASHPRLIVYSPGTSNPLLTALPYIYDTQEYLKDAGTYLQKHPRIRIEKKANPSQTFKLLATLRGFSIVLDDVAALKTHPQERSDFDGFIRTVRYNGNRVIITTHRANKDLSPLVRTVGTSFYYVGPGTRSQRELLTLYDLTNFPISFPDFCRGITQNPARHAQTPAGIFPIRKA